MDSGICQTSTASPAQPGGLLFVLVFRSRPEMNQQMSDAQRRRFDVVLCWKVDRFGRSLKHWSMRLLTSMFSAWPSSAFATILTSRLLAVA